jgi:hypothetical protein
MTTNQQLNDSFDSMAGTALRVKKDRDDMLGMLKLVKSGYDYNPGSSDLDDEQPISVSMTLGDYRKIVRLIYRAERS